MEGDKSSLWRLWFILSDHVIGVSCDFEYFRSCSSDLEKPPSGLHFWRFPKFGLQRCTHYQQISISRILKLWLWSYYNEIISIRTLIWSQVVCSRRPKMASTASTGATPSDWEFDKFDDGSLSKWCVYLSWQFPSFQNW